MPDLVVCIQPGGCGIASDGRLEIPFHALYTGGEVKGQATVEFANVNQLNTAIADAAKVALSAAFPVTFVANDRATIIGGPSGVV